MCKKTVSKVCSVVVFLFIFMNGISMEAQKSKARARMISLDRIDFSSAEKTGYDFENVKFKYQFVTCKGHVLLGVTYDKNAVFIRYWKNNKPYYKKDLDFWPNPKDIRINNMSADLYFGSRKLGRVDIKSMPEKYHGCSGKMYNVLAFVGLNSKDKVYKTNINKLSLRNLRVEKASTKTGSKKSS